MTTHLVPLPEVERLSKTCIRILGGNPGKFTLQGTNTYLVGTGSKRLLIDAGQGMPSWSTAVQKVLKEEKATIQSCLITHWHGDHTTGIYDLNSFSPATTVHKAEPGDDQEEITDGKRFSVEGATLVAVHSPGHTTDHTAFVLEEEDAMFTGDNVLGHGTAVFEDLSTYLDSLNKMAGMFRGRAYPGHGPVIADGPAKMSEYQAHRKRREDQVFNCLCRESAPGNTGVEGREQVAREGGEEGDRDEGGGQGWKSMDLVKVIYSDVREDLHEAAERGIIQILLKLEDEGKVIHRLDGSWTPTRRASL